VVPSLLVGTFLLQVPLLLLANPLFLPFFWQDETDVPLPAGLVGLA